MGGCSSRSMLENVDRDGDADFAPLPAPENQESPVNVAGKTEEETSSIDLDVTPELELEQMKQEEVKVEEAHELATEAEKETSIETLITETTTDEIEQPEAEASQAEEAREAEVVTVETIQVSDSQVKADADEAPEAEACVAEEAEEHFDVDPAEAETFEEVENETEASEMAEESEKTTKEEEAEAVEEDQPATLRSRLSLWLKSSLQYHFPLPSLTS
ncbi:putative inactive protein kinase [Salvia divinorum]|uniref:Inactive protein kinase n=1 Tax=Salvia divinorum TaxID=28513 RepID=A0ABD1G0R8_SALDI